MGSEKRFSWSSSLPALALVVVVMLVCSGIYSWWQRARHQVSAHESPPPVLQPVETPAPQAATVPQPVPAQQDPGAQAPAIPTPTTETAAAPPVERSAARPAETNSADRPAPEAPSGPAPAAPAALPAIVPAVRQGDLASAPPVTPPVRTGPVKLELTAAEPVWVLAQANGKYLFSGTLDANQTRTVEATGTVVLRLGNAGGLNITLNGKPLGTVGPKGQVRTVQFTSGGFQIVAAPKPSLVDPL